MNAPAPNNRRRRVVLRSAAAAYICSLGALLWSESLRGGGMLAGIVQWLAAVAGLLFTILLAAIALARGANVRAASCILVLSAITLAWVYLNS